MRCFIDDDIVHVSGSVRAVDVTKCAKVTSASLHAQTTLGFVKDVQAGTCQMRHLTAKGPGDCELIPLTLYNLKGSGLRAICILAHASRCSGGVGFDV